MSSPPSISRRSSLAERVSSALPAIRPRLPSLRSRKPNGSINSVNGTDHRRSSSYRPYSVYQQTMHPAILRDADATNKLFEAILDTPGGRRSLSRLARTCKAFKEPVLDILWRDLDSLAPLIGLFPNTLLKRARRPGLGLAKNPERDDWNRLLAYGERVRSISYMESSGNISPTIFPILEELRPRQWLLPNLTSLTWKSETAAGLERCRLFLGPELRNITLEVGTKHPKLNDLLVEIASHARLSSLAFTLHTNLPDNFTDIFHNNLSLEKVCIAAPGALSARVGLWAAQLPKLRSFTVDLTGRTTTAVEGFFDDISPGSGASTPSSVGGTDSGVFSGDELDFSEIRKSAVRLTGDGPRHGAFAHLTHLQLSGETSNVATFLKHLTSPLTHLELLIDDPPASEDWQDVCGLVCEQFSYTLQVFRVSPTSASRFQELVRSTSRGGDTPVRHLPLTHLGPLPRLHRLDIDLPESVLFHESDIAHLANMCPSLEILRLSALARWPSTVGPPALTLEGLVPLMRQCRRLHTLAVVVNALDGSEGILSTREVSSRSLQRLHVGHSWIKDPLQTAILLSHVAPFLDNLKWFHEKNRAVVVEANALAWQKVSEFLPHLQNIRLAERRQQPQPQVYVPPPTAEKAVDATVITVDQGILAKPQLVESEVQAEVEFADASVQMAPEVESVSVDATPVLVDTGILVVPTFAERAVDARPETEEKAIDMRGTPPLETTSRPGNIAGVVPSVLSYLPSPATGLVSLTFRVARFYTFPFRYMYSFMPSLSKSADALQAETEPKSPVPGEQEEDLAEKHENGNALSPSQETAVSPDTVYDAVYSTANEMELTHAHPPANKTGPVSETDVKATKAATWSRERAKGNHVSGVFEASQNGKSSIDVSATRQSDSTTRTARQPFLSSLSRKYTMSESRRQEKDHTKDVDELIPQAKSLAQAGKLQDALDKLLVLEKQTRNSSDTPSTTRVAKEICLLCYEARNYALLNSSISTLSKKHGQLKGTIQGMVEQAMTWLDDIRQREGDEKWLELIKTLRDVTEGKIFLETPRARVTLQLAHYHEALAASSKPGSPSTKESLETASELLSDLQVETYSSMERREKTEFLLEQMRLLIAFARIKDAEIGQEGKKDTIGGGESEWVKVRVGSRKVSESFLNDKANEDLKLKFYEMMIQYALKQSAYLDAAKYYHKVWETPSIKEEELGRGREAFAHVVYYLILAPHDNEQSDMLHRIYNDPTLQRLEELEPVMKSFITQEIMRWSGVGEMYGPFLRGHTVFRDDKLWEDLHKRVIEHNIRIIALYYTRITFSRLAALLELPQREAEETLCRLVVSGTVWAKVDRPAGIINFRKAKSAEDVMNDWSSDMQKLLGLVEKTWMGVNAAQAAQSRVKA